MNKGNKGITIISLVITIVVLIILASVSITVFGENGLIETAKKASDRIEEEATKEEELYIKNFGEWLNTVVNGTDVQVADPNPGPDNDVHVADPSQGQFEGPSI